jgi:hypothetical protein
MIMKSNEAELCDAVFTFSQEGNCMDGAAVEDLEVRVTSSLGVEHEESYFYVLKTEQWAIDDIEDLSRLLNRVKTAVDTFINKKQ